MTKDDKLSKLGADLGVLLAAIYTSSAAIYLLTDEALPLFIYFIMSAYMLFGPMFMSFLMIFKDFFSKKLKNAIHDSIVRSSVIDKDFILNYLILSIGYSLPFFLNGGKISKIWAFTCVVTTIYMLFKMFDINKTLKNDLSKTEVKKLN